MRQSNRELDKFDKILTRVFDCERARMTLRGAEGAARGERDFRVYGHQAIGPDAEIDGPFPGGRHHPGHLETQIRALRDQAQR